MDPTEITKHIPEVASVATVAAASIPFTSIVKRMLGPAADEVAEMWRDQVRVYRYERQAKLIEKVDRIATEAGFTPQAVPPKVLFPLLEGSSFEDDENLHDMWAALLANAASPEHAETVRPGFVAILKQMAPDEAKLLNWIYQSGEHGYEIGIYKLVEADSSLGWKEKERTGRYHFSRRLLTSLDCLEAEQLVRRNYVKPEHSESPSADGEPLAFQFQMTSRGRAFIDACRPPKPKS